MDSNDYQRKVVESITQIKLMQEGLAKATNKQIELLERLVGLEHDAAASRKTLERMFDRLDAIEEEVDNWKVMRKLVTWIGPAGLIALVWVLYEYVHTVRP
jgi:hypothetical protein